MVVCSEDRDGGGLGGRYGISLWLGYGKKVRRMGNGGVFQILTNNLDFLGSCFWKKCSLYILLENYLQ